MSALRAREIVCGLSDAKAAMRGLRTGLYVYRHRRWARDLHHHAGGCDRRGLRADRGNEVSAAVLGARRALAAADSGHHAIAAALDEGASDRAAIPSQGSARSPGAAAID